MDVRLITPCGVERRTPDEIEVHQGCRLCLDAARNLDCPCHTTVFALSGELVTHQLPLAPPPLPRFATREMDGAVQVYAPTVV